MKQENETEKLLKNIDNFADFISKNEQKLLEDSKKMKLLNKILSYSNESGVNISDIRQFISELIDEI